MLKLLDLFCGAGGAAMGYHRAGFDVLGVDSAPQPNYPFAFRQGDALDFLAEHWEGFDVIHASPPCQGYSELRKVTGRQYESASLLPETLGILRSLPRPYVVENVPGSQHLMRDPLMLCGTSFGLLVQRHRYFETSFPVPSLPCRHSGHTYNPHSKEGRERIYARYGRGCPEKRWRSLVGVEWMTRAEGRQSIPPAYTELIGTQLMTLAADSGA